MKPYLSLCRGRWQLIGREGQVIASARTAQELSGAWERAMQAYRASQT